MSNKKINKINNNNYTETINDTTKPIKNITKPTKKITKNTELIRHKYKVEQGKKVYTFKNKSEVSKNMNITNKKISKLLTGEINDKIKISLI